MNEPFFYAAFQLHTFQQTRSDRICSSLGQVTTKDGGCAMTKDEIWEIVAKAIDYHGINARSQKSFDKQLREESQKSQNEWQEKMVAQTRTMAFATWVMALASWALVFLSLWRRP